MSIFIISCAIPFVGGYPGTRFYVKNNSDTIISFDSTVRKYSRLSGTYDMTVTFSVLPHDSVLARYVGFKKNSKNPQNWFVKFTIYPVEGVKLNDPNKPENWKKRFDSKNEPYFTFIIAE